MMVHRTVIVFGAVEDEHSRFTNVYCDVWLGAQLNIVLLKQQYCF